MNSTIGVSQKTKVKAVSKINKNVCKRSGRGGRYYSINCGSKRTRLEVFRRASNAQICVTGFWSGPSVFHRKPTESKPVRKVEKGDSSGSEV